jgi:hypothetical protein
VQDLSDSQRALLTRQFPEGIEFRRIDSTNYLEHDELCKKLDPAAVILPKDRPIPVLAIEHGYPHLVFSSTELMELVRLQPELKPFQRRSKN